MAEINELFAEAIQRCVEVRGELHHAGDVIDALLARAEALGELVSSRSDESHRELGEISTRWAAAEHHLQDAGAQAAAALRALKGRASQAEEQTEAVVEAAQEHLADLAARRRELESQQEAREEAATTGWRGLTGRVHEVETAVADGLERASAELESFRETLGEAREDCRGDAADLSAALERAEDAAREQVRACVAGIEGPFHHAVDALAAELPHDLLIEAHNQAIAGLMQKLTEDAKAQIVEALGPLRAAMEDLRRGGEEQQGRVQQDTADLLKKAQAALQRLERLRPTWALALRLG
ncbi:MAG TPA: hypothetical protein VF310_01115 [Vicinamibacteria bacterium]